MEVKTTYDKDGNMKKTYIITVGYISKKEAEKKFKELLKLYNDRDAYTDRYIKEYYKKDERKLKLEKIEKSYNR